MADKFNFKLYYFNIAGKADCIRLAFKHLDIPFEDYRFQAGEFVEMKKSGKLAFGQVPALEITNKESGKTEILCQSAAILRFIAKLDAKNTGLYPRCPVQAAKVDAILDQEADCFQAFRALNYKDRFGMKSMSAEDQQKYKDEVNRDNIPMNFELLVKILKANGNGWLAGTANPSIADLAWGAILEAVYRGWTGVGKSAFDNFPDLVAYLERYWALPTVKNFYEERPFGTWWN